MNGQINPTPDYLARFLIIARALEGAALAMAPLKPHEYDLVLACLNAQTAPALDFDIKADIPNPHGEGPRPPYDAAPQVVAAPVAQDEDESEDAPAGKPEAKGKRKRKASRAKPGAWKDQLLTLLSDRGIGGSVTSEEVGKLLELEPAAAYQRILVFVKGGVLKRSTRGAYEIQGLTLS